MAEPIKKLPLKKKRSKKKRKVKPFWIVASSLILAFWFSTFIGQMPARQSPAVPLSPEKPLEETATLATPLLGPATSNQITPQVSNEVPQRLANAGLSEIAPEIDSQGGTNFAVRVKTKATCHPGDFEAMSNVFGANGSLLLSLEPMDKNPEGKNRATPITRTIALKEIEEGIKLSLPIDMKKTGVYGIYLCGDASGTRSCGGKAAADFNRILNFKRLETQKDSVFFYQFSVLGNDSATAYTGTAEGVATAREALEQGKKGKAQVDWQDQMARAATMMRGVASLTPTTVREGDVIVLELQVARGNRQDCR